jgi:hypothetical protein
MILADDATPKLDGIFVKDKFYASRRMDGCSEGPAERYCR